MIYYIFGLFLFLHGSHALICYNCTYWKGYPGSTSNCKKKDPGSKYLIDCRTRAMMHLEDPGSSRSGGRDVYCIKTVGIANGIEFLYRTCAVENWDGDRNNKCLQTNINDTIVIPQKDNVTVDGQLCYCKKKKCNAASNSCFGDIYFTVSFCFVAVFSNALLFSS